MLVILSVVISSRLKHILGQSELGMVSHDLNGKLVVEMWWG